jgi:hypothetical protein
LPAAHTSHRPRSSGSLSGRSIALLGRRCKPAWQVLTNAPDANTRSRLTLTSAVRTAGTGFSSRSVALQSKS